MLSRFQLSDRLGRAGFARREQIPVRAGAAAPPSKRGYTCGGSGQETGLKTEG